MSRDDAAVFVFDTWGDPEQAARDISLAVEAHSRGFVYVRPHLRRWPERGKKWAVRKSRRRAM
jgi:hypothetical protein